MKRLIYILPLLLLIFSVKSYSQIKIDDIRNDSDVVRFVAFYGHKYNKGWKNINLGFDSTSFKKYLTPKQAHFTDSVGRQKWIISDFNGDGRNDLIFYGRIYFTQAAVMAFISENSDSISCTSLGNILTMSYPSSISEIKSDGNNLLQLGIFHKRNLPGEWIKSYETDTLIYKFGGFIEYNRKSYKELEFDSLVYETSSSWGAGYFPSKLWVYKNNEIKLFQQFYRLNDSLIVWDVIYKSEIRKELSNEIKSLLGYISFGNLKPDYSLLMVSDQTSVNIKVYYQDKVKQISDYGMYGTYGLGLLYTKLGEIMNSYKLWYKR